MVILQKKFLHEKIFYARYKMVTTKASVLPENDLEILRPGRHSINVLSGIKTYRVPVAHGPLILAGPLEFWEKMPIYMYLIVNIHFGCLGP